MMVRAKLSNNVKSEGEMSIGFLYYEDVGVKEFQKPHGCQNKHFGLNCEENRKKTGGVAPLPAPPRYKMVCGQG
jgi:hypothetical protein